MADGFSIDTSQIDRLAADLAEIPDRAGGLLRSALTVTARRVKDTWNENLYRDGHASRTGRAISYDITGRGGRAASSLTAEIGAVRGSGRQAYIVRLLELGSAHNPPHGAGLGALQANEGDFEHGIDLAIRGAEKSAGL